MRNKEEEGICCCCILLYKGNLEVCKWHGKHSFMTCPCLFPTTFHQSGWHIWSLLFSYGLLKKRKDGKQAKRKKKKEKKNNISGSSYLQKKKKKDYFWKKAGDWKLFLHKHMSFKYKFGSSLPISRIKNESKKENWGSAYEPESELSLFKPTVLPTSLRNLLVKNLSSFSGAFPTVGGEGQGECQAWILTSGSCTHHSVGRP